MKYVNDNYYICFMLVTKTIRIDDELHKDATDHIKKLGVSGGFSGYVQSLIINDLKKKILKKEVR